jgi:predicted ABC-type ATPase
MGHPVAAERILTRFPRTLANLTQGVRLADAAVLYDSQDVTPGTHTAVAMCKGNWTKELVQPVPQWAQLVLGLR